MCQQLTHLIFAVVVAAAAAAVADVACKQLVMAMGKDIERERVLLAVESYKDSCTCWRA